MKATPLTVGIGVMIFAAFLYVQPLLTIRVLAGALEKSDVEAIRERMDADSVRHGLRDAFLERHRLEGHRTDQDAARIASLTLFSKGIEMLIATVAPENAAQEQGGPTKIDAWEYDSISRFHVTLAQESGSPMTLVLQRQGMSWHVVAMRPSESAWRDVEKFLVRGSQVETQ